MRRSTLLENLNQQFEDDPEYVVEGILLHVAEAICAEMERQKLSRSELAKRMGVRRQYITQFLNTPTNTTLLTIARFAKALAVDFATLLSGAVEGTQRVPSARTMPALEWWLPATPQGLASERTAGSGADQNLSKAA